MVNRFTYIRAILVKLLYIVCLILLSGAELKSQWRKVADFGDDWVNVIYFSPFQDSLRVGYVGINNSDGLYRTTDGGKSWTLYKNHGNPVSFAFKDSLTGWFVNRGDTYRTLDGGSTWTRFITNLGSGEGLYYNQKSSRLFRASWGTGLSYSDDLGDSWSFIPREGGNCGVAFINDSIGFSTQANGDPLKQISFRTTDHGLTWQKNPFDHESWGPFATQTSRVFYAPGEMGGGGLWKSTDLGITWYRPRAHTLSGLTGHMEGNDCRLYVHTNKGVYRSLDTGYTFQLIGGPTNKFDTRALFVKGRQVYAGGEDGSLWYLYDTAADARDLRMLVSKTTIDFDTVAECSSPKQTIHFHNYRQCDSLRLLKVELATLPPALSYSLSDVGTIPRRIEPESGDSLVVEFTNVGLGKYISQVKITFLIDGRVVDTIISVTGVRVPSGKATASPTLVNFDTISFCSEREDTVILRHNGCDSATAELLYAPPSIFTIISPIFPIRLGPGEQIPVRVKYKPQSLGAVNDDIIFAVKIDGTGQQQGVTVKLTGTAEKLFTIPELDPSILVFPQMTICDTGRVFTNLTITNPSGCDSVMIRTVVVDSMNFRSETSATSYSLSPGSTQNVAYSFAQTGKGSYTFTVPIQYFNGKEWVDTVLSAIADVSGGTRILSSSRDSLDFGITTLCEERDSFITLSNTGCDTFRITNIDLLGKGFTTDTTIPITIPPGSSITIPVSTKVDTTQGNASNGIITFASDADNQIAPIALSRGYTYPKSYSFHIAMLDGTATSDEIVRLAIVGEQGLGSAGSGVNRLDFDLTLNEDLLEYIKPEGTNNVNKNGSHITISNSNELTSTKDTLAILIFHVFLTKDSATDITVSNISINNGDTSTCAPKIAGITQAGFTYRYECGDKQIQSFLRTGQASLQISSIRPNPTSADAIVSFKSVIDEKVKIQVIDDLGRVVLEEALSIVRGDNTHTIAIPKYLSGVFYVRMKTQGNVVSKRFIKY